MDKIKKVFGYRTTPTTFLISIIYLGLFISVLITDELPNVPSRKGGLSLDEAYKDLHHVSTQTF